MFYFHGLNVHSGFILVLNFLCMPTKIYFLTSGLSPQSVDSLCTSVSHLSLFRSKVSGDIFTNAFDKSI